MPAAPWDYITEDDIKQGTGMN